MPSRYQFSITPDPGATFSCNLYCDRCDHIKSDGIRCKNRVCYGSPTCWIHTRQRYGVKLRPSNIAGAGKGLYSTRIFPEDSWICPYVGEPISAACLDIRYPGDTTAPYAVENDGPYVDSACTRGIGAMANGLFKRDGTSRTPNQHNAEIADNADCPAHTKWLKATKNIPADREIYVYYGDAYQLQNNHTTKRTTRAEKRHC